jgi:ribosome recycling factor
LKEIRAGINAFTLMEKELKESNIPLEEESINKTLRLINKTMSTEIIKNWIRKCRSQLECEKPERKEFEATVKRVESEIKEKEKDKKEFKDIIKKIEIEY